MAYKPPIEAIKEFPLEQRKAAARLSRKFWELSGKDPKVIAEPLTVISSWKLFFLNMLKDWSEDELNGVIDYALCERIYWVSRLMEWYAKDGYTSPFHRFTDEFAKLGSEYAAKKRKEDIRARKVNATPTSDNYSPVAEVNKPQHQLGDDWIETAKRVRAERAAKKAMAAQKQE
jgi:hypothetical protein